MWLLALRWAFRREGVTRLWRLVGASVGAVALWTCRQPLLAGTAVDPQSGLLQVEGGRSRRGRADRTRRRVLPPRDARLQPLVAALGTRVSKSRRPTHVGRMASRTHVE